MAIHGMDCIGKDAGKLFFFYIELYQVIDGTDIDASVFVSANSTDFIMGKSIAVLRRAIDVYLVTIISVQSFTGAKPQCSYLILIDGKHSDLRQTVFYINMLKVNMIPIAKESTTEDEDTEYIYSHIRFVLGLFSGTNLIIN